MEQINFREWRVMASVVDSDLLRLEAEALDGSDIVEMSGPEGEREGEQYSLHLTTQNLEEAHRQRSRRRDQDSSREADDDEPGATWPADEDETIYLRGWEVEALVDEDGLLTVTVEHGGAEVYEIEPLESGVTLSSHIVVRLAAEDTDDDEDEDEEEDSDLEDDFEDLDQMDELDDNYYDDLGEEEDDLDEDDVFEEDEDLY